LASNDHSDQDSDEEDILHEFDSNGDHQYATDRRALLAQRTSAPSRVPQLIARRHEQDNGKVDKKQELSDESESEGMNVTEELFSDAGSEEEGAAENLDSNETSEFSSSGTNRHNPFKVRRN